jgi:copper chaperone CopZ
MKTVKIILVVLIATLLGGNSYAQMQDHSKMASTKTETLKVSGNCDMCKARIEKAAKYDGVSKAEWDKKSKLLAVTYDPAKTSMDVIAKKVAAVGHDNSLAKADDKAYNALDGCCKYDRKK